MRFGHYGPGVTVVVMEGSGMNAFNAAPGLTLQVGDILTEAAAKSNVQFDVDIDEIEEQDNGPDVLFGFISQPADVFLAGSYFARFTFQGAVIDTEPVPVPAGFIPTEPVIYSIGSAFEGEFDGRVRFNIPGDLFDQVTIISVDISTDPDFTTIFETVSVFEVKIDEEGVIDLIEGDLSRSIFEILPGLYYFRLNFADGTSLISDAFPFGGARLPAIEPRVDFAVFGPGPRPGVSVIRIFGSNLDLVDVTRIDIQVSQDATFRGFHPVFSVFDLTLTVNPENGELILSGFIPEDFGALPAGDYFLRNRFEGETDSDVFTFFHEGPFNLPGARIVFVPNMLSFGTVPLGETDSLSVFIFNDGDTTLTITEIIPGRNFFPAQFDLPGIEPGTSEELSIVFEPFFEGVFRDTLFFGSNDPLRPFAPLFVRGRVERIDVFPPEFFEFPEVVRVDTGSAVIAFTTNKRTTAEVTYGEVDIFNLDFNLFEFPDFPNSIIESELKRKHKTEIPDLLPNTDYGFVVFISDSLGSGPTQSPVSFFRTLDEIDKTPPLIIDGPFFHPIDDSTVVVLWATDELGTSVIEFDEGSILTATPQVFEDSLLVQFHQIFLTGLIANSEYSFRVGSVDELGNGPRFSPKRSFRTLSTADIVPPEFLEQPHVLGADTSRAVIVYFTDEPANTVILFNVDSLFEQGIFREFSDSTFVQSHRVLLTGLDPGTNYLFNAEATDRAGNGPSFSFAFGFRTKSQADNRPPVFLGFPTVLEQDTNFVSIGWLTDEISSTIVEYQTLEQFKFDRIRIEDPELVTDHFITIPNLSSGTKYFYLIKSVDASGNIAETFRISIFETAKTADLDPPIIFCRPHIAERDTDRVVIKWFTDERATSIVEYALDDLFDDPAQRLLMTNLTLTREHGITLFGLTSSTEYEFRVGSEDAFGNGPTFSELGEFETSELADVFPPVIFGFPEVRIIDTSTVAIAWRTDEEASSRVDFFTDGIDPNVEVREDQDLDREHVVILTDLFPGTRYFYLVVSTDSKANSVFKGPFSFETSDRTDLIPPVFRRFPSVANVDTSSFVIGWVTDEPAISEVEYGFASDWPNNTNIELIPDFTKIHQVTLTNLESDSAFFYWVRLIDRAGNESGFSPRQEFRTLVAVDALPPEFVGLVNITGIDTSKVTVRWRTNEASTSIVEIGREDEWPVNTRTIVDQELTKNHAVLVKELVSNTDYRLRVSSVDANGNVSDFSAEYDFRTRGFVDELPPRFVGRPSERDLDTTSVTIILGTNEPATARIEVNQVADTTVVFSFSEGALEERHNIFLFGLSSNTEYDYQVFVTDANGNGRTASAVQRFRTLDTPDLTTPRLVADPIIIGRTHESASIKFGTDEVSYVAIVFGTDSTDLRAAVPELQGRTTHVIRWTDLADSTLYFYEIEGRDIKGNEFIFPPPGRPRQLQKIMKFR